MAFQHYNAHLLSHLLPMADAVCMQLRRDMLQRFSQDYGIPLGELYSKYMDVVLDGPPPTEPKESNVIETQTPEWKPPTETAETQCDPPPPTQIVDIQTLPAWVEVPSIITRDEPPPAPPSTSSDGERRKPGRPKVRPQVVKKVNTKPCGGFTTKGDPCKHCVPDGSAFCKLHLTNHGKSKQQQTDELEAKRAIKKGKKPRVEQIHNHPPGKTPQTPCTVCDTVGDITKPSASTSTPHVTANIISTDEAHRRYKEFRETHANVDFDTDDDDDDDISPELIARVANQPLRGDDIDDDDTVWVDDITTSQTKKLKAIIASRDEIDEDEVDMDQVTETPHSRAIIQEMINDGLGDVEDDDDDDLSEDDEEPGTDEE